MQTKIRSVNRQLKAPSVPIKTETSKPLPLERQKKLEEILNRETLKSKTDQLKAILEKKMTIKYGRLVTKVVFILLLG